MVRPAPTLPPLFGLVVCLVAPPALPGVGPGLAQETPRARRPAGREAQEAQDREATLLFNTASRLYRQESWEEAAGAFGDFLKRFARHPDAPEARFARGYSLLRLERHGDAALELRAAVSALASVPGGEAPWAAEAHFHLARALEALAGKEPAGTKDRREGLRAAAASYGIAARLAPPPRPAAADDPSAGPGKGAKGAKGAGGRGEGSLDLKPLALASQGEALYQGGFHADAARALAPFLEDAERYRGSPHLARGLYILALSMDAQAEELGQADRSRAKEILGRLSGSEFERDPLADEAGFLLARMLHREGSRGEAIERYARVAQRGGARAGEAAYHRAVALYENQTERDLEAARREMARFLERHPGHALAARASFYEALCLFDGKRYGEAAAKLRPIAEGGGELAARARLRLGQALLLKEKPEAAGALAALEEAARAPGVEAAPAAEAAYWQGEALLALGGDRLAQAARHFSQVAGAHRAAAPDLAEKALYQAARASFLAKDHRGCAELSRRYRERYPGDAGRYRVESLRLSAENALESPPGQLDEEERQAAPRHYAEAAALVKDPAAARRLRYLAALAVERGGDLAAAALALEEVLAEDRAEPLPGFREPELGFHLATVLVQMPRPPQPGPAEEERWRRAALLFEEYLGAGPEGPNAATARVNRGLCLTWLGEAGAARRSFEGFLKAHPGHALVPEVRFELANLALSAGELETAVREYIKAAGGAQPPLAARALLQAAVIERRRGKPEAALEALGAIEGKHAAALARESGGKDLLADAQLQKALVLSDLSRQAEARRELEAHLERFPGNPKGADARLQLARLLLDAAEPQAALKALAPLADGSPSTRGRDQALYLRAWCHRALAASGPEGERHQKAMVESYERLIAEHPESDPSVEARLELAQHEFERKAYPEARRRFAEARDRIESAAASGEAGERRRDALERATFGLAFAAFEEKDHREARALFDQVAARAESPLCPRALFQSGRAWMLSQGEAEAAARFERLVGELAPRARDLAEESLLRLAECYHRLQRYKESAAAAERQLREHADGKLRHEGLFTLGFARQFLDENELAIQSYRKVVAGTQAPVAARAQYHIGECLQEAGKHREAAREFLAVAANFDFDGPYRDWVRRALLAAGLAYQAAGDRKAARAQYEDLKQRFPDSEEGRAAAKRLEEVKE